MRTLLASLAIAAVASACGHGPPSPAVAEATPTPQPLTRAERHALAAAHSFVREQCYTSLRCEPRDIEPEFMEEGLPPSVLYEMRKDTLKPWAYGISGGTRGKPGPGWTVFFDRTEQPEGDPSLRALYLDDDFQPIQMEHLAIRMDAPAKKVTFVEAGPNAEAEDAG